MQVVGSERLVLLNSKPTCILAFCGRALTMMQRLSTMTLSLDLLTYYKVYIVVERDLDVVERSGYLVRFDTNTIQLTS